MTGLSIGHWKGWPGRTSKYERFQNATEYLGAQTFFRPLTPRIRERSWLRDPSNQAMGFVAPSYFYQAMEFCSLKFVPLCLIALPESQLSFLTFLTWRATRVHTWWLGSILFQTCVFQAAGDSKLRAFKSDEKWQRKIGTNIDQLTNIIIYFEPVWKHVSQLLLLRQLTQNTAMNSQNILGVNLRSSIPRRCLCGPFFVLLRFWFSFGCLLRLGIEALEQTVGCSLGRQEQREGRIGCGTCFFVFTFHQDVDTNNEMFDSWGIPTK